MVYLIGGYEAWLLRRSLEVLFGGKGAAKVLPFIENYGDGYASRIAKTFDVLLSEVQKQRRKFERAGSWSAGW